MSNSADFFQSDCQSLAVPAAKVSVLVEGRMCTELAVKEVVRSGWPEFGWAKLVLSSDAIAAENVESVASIGKEVVIEQVYNGLAGGVGLRSLVIFSGIIDSIETVISEDSDEVEIVARDISSELRRVTVYGRHIAAAGGDVFLAGLDTVFNEDGEGNRGNANLFCAEVSDAKAWNWVQVIEYLLSYYAPAGRLLAPDIERLDALTPYKAVRDLDVTGQSLLEALHSCCERVGLSFRFTPVTGAGGVKQAIVFYRPGKGRRVEINCQKSGEKLGISRSDTWQVRVEKNFRPVTHRYIGQGDFRTYEATFELIQAWDSSLEDNNYEKFSPSTNSEFYKVRDVYRKWCSNEGGDYSGEPYNRGSAFDFSRIFEGDSCVVRRRRFYPALTRDAQGKSVGYFLEVSYDGGEHWWQYLYAYNNLLDECGIWLSSDQLDVNTWIAAMKGLLKFRITASVVSDARLQYEASDGPVNSAAPVIDQVITLPRQFRYRKVSGASIFYGSDEPSLPGADEVDDTDRLCEFVRNRVENGAATISTAQVRTPLTAYGYEVGDVVTSSPESRDILGIRGDNRSTSRIERVHIDYKNQCTNLKVVRKREV